MPSLHKYIKGASATEEVTGGTIEEYPNIIEIAEQLHTTESEPLLDHISMSKYQPIDPTEMIDSVTKNLVYFLKHKKHVDTYFLNPLIRIIVKETRRIDLTYLVVQDLLEKKQKYIDPTFEGNFITTYTFVEMVKEYMPQTHGSLSRIGALDDKYLNMIFVDFFVEILPEAQVLRIVDAYLVEGVKVLFRYGLALIKGYKDLIKSDKYETAKDFWVSVKADAIAVSSTFDIPLLFKAIGTEEHLPPVDPFLVYSSSRNKQFTQDNTITNFAYEGDRSGFAKITRPMPISKGFLDTCRAAAVAKFLASNPIGSPHNTPMKQGGVAASSTPGGKSPGGQRSGSVTLSNVRRSTINSGKHTTPLGTPSAKAPSVASPAPTGEGETSEGGEKDSTPDSMPIMPPTPPVDIPTNGEAPVDAPVCESSGEASILE